MNSFRADVARYYDLGRHLPADVPFYLERLGSATDAVLELGCGTGRVSIPLAEACGELRGVDHSVEMLRIARERAEAAGLDRSRVSFSVADIVDVSLDRTFDLIVAPFRVVQNLETDAQLNGLFRSIRRHLAPGGRCILNVFNPRGTKEELIGSWVTAEPEPMWTVPFEDGEVTRYDHRLRLQPDPLVLYPELVYEYAVAGVVVDRAVLRIAMRCYYPDDFVARIEDARFTVTDRWGGYAGEPYGEGPELLVEFSL
ncbi:MAG: class I SAM-dependent methyltransferase [Gemmatimonadota bacterium]